MTSLGEDLLVTVNKLQDLVFNTIGNDSLDLPQIVSWLPGSFMMITIENILDELNLTISLLRLW